MAKKVESWIDPITPQDIEQMLKDRYNYDYNGVPIECLLDWSCNIGKYRVDIYYKYREDYDEFEEVISCNEFNGGSVSIEDKMKSNMWTQLLERKNQGRLINGKTYVQARAEWLEKQIEEYFQFQHDKLEKQKENLLYQVEKMKKVEIQNEELGEY